MPRRRPGKSLTKTAAVLFTATTGLLLATAVRAQMEEPFPPADVDTPIDFPYTPPPIPGDPDGGQPLDVTNVTYGSASDAYGAPPATEAGPEVTEVSYTGGEDVIADSYDDGYDPAAYRAFEETLSPYGTWVDDDRYGRIWVPARAVVGFDFLPYYSGGNWVLSEYGWTWVSDFSWGWAPFHYGRWVVTSGWGWSWVPGTMWGPAWVSWRVGGGYVGWAPLPPRGVVLAADFGTTSPWRFTHAVRLGAARVSCIPPSQMPGIFRRTTVLANDRLLQRGGWTVHVNAGPVRAARSAPVTLATAAPQALPKVRIVPRTGTSLGTRPWNQPITPSLAGVNGARPGPRRAPGYPPPVAVPSPAHATTISPREFAPTPASRFLTAPVRPALRTEGSARTFYPPASAPANTASASAPPAFRSPSASPSPSQPSPTFHSPSSPSAFHPAPREPTMVRTDFGPPAPRVVRETTFTPPPRTFAPQTFADPAPRTFATPSPRTFATPAPQTFAPAPSAAPSTPRTFAPPAVRTFNPAPAGQPAAPAPAIRRLGDAGGAHFGGAHRR